MNWLFKKSFILFILSVLFLNSSFALQGSPQSFTFQGRLFNAAGTDPLTEVVTLRFQILDPTATCLLYQETQNVDLTNTSGVFAVNVGSALGAVKRTAGADPGLSMAQIFRNDSAIQTRATHATCTGGYTPAVGDVRLLRVTVTPQSTGTPETLSPDQVINSVPQAIVAETLQGLTPSDFVQKDPIYITDANLKKLFGSLVDGVVDASTLHTHDDRYVQISSSSSQNLGSGGFNTSGKGSVGTSTNFTSTTMSVKADSDTNVGVAIRASSGGQSADLLQVQNSAGVKLAGISATGGLAATTSTITSTAGNQLVVKYDNTNTQTLDVSSSGTSTFTASGSSPQFGFLGGSVGIGTSAPGRILHVSSSSAPTVLLENTSGGADQKKRYTTTTTTGDAAWGKFSDDLSTTTEQMRLLSNGALGIGVTSPTATLHLKAGVAAANGAPLKFNTGVLLTTPENGALEYDGTDYYVTSGGTRKKLSTSSGSGDFTSLTNSSGALSISSGGTNQNLTLSASGTGSVTTASTTRITNTTSSTSSSTGALVVSGGAGFAGNVFSGGGFFSPLGSAAAPTFGFAGDSDTGVFSPGADTLGIATGGSERLRVDSSGRVGIGTNAPGAKLEVAGTGGSLFVDNYQISSNRNPINGAVVDSSKGSATMVLSTSASGGNIQFWNNAATGGTISEKMRITEAGNVGIGTTSPTMRLHVVDSTATAAGGFNKIFSSYSTGLADGSNSQIAFGRANSTLNQAEFNFYYASSGSTSNALKIGLYGQPDIFNIVGSGYVGIGTATPASKLDVVGDVSASGNLNLTSASSLVGFNSASSRSLFGSTNSSGAYMQMFGKSNNLSGTTPAGGAEFVIDSTNGATKFNILNYNGSTWPSLFSVLSSGNVGIGNLSPSNSLDIGSSSTATPIYLGVNTNGGGNNVAGIKLSGSNATSSIYMDYFGSSSASTGSVGHGLNFQSGRSSPFDNIWFRNASGNVYGGFVNSGFIGPSVNWGQLATTHHFVFSGSLGIGTVNPTNKLSVTPSFYSTGTASQSGTTVTGTGTTWTSGMVGLQLVYANGASGGTITAFNSSTSLTVSSSQTVTNQAYTISYTGLQVDSSGRVGIGTTSPTNTLTVSGAANILGNNPEPFAISRSGMNNWVFRVTHGGLGIDANSLIVKPSSTTGVASDFAVKGSTADSGLPDFVVKSSGNVGVGLASPATKLQVEGVISPATNNAYTLGSSTYRFTEVYATNGTINTSDRREKKDIQNSDLGIDFINKLRPVSYRWNTGVDQDVHYGLIAQEADQVLKKKTSIVTYDKKSDRFGVRYSELISPLIKAIQELYLRFIGIEKRETEQDRKIATISAENQKLKDENAAIKAYLCEKDPKAAFCRSKTIQKR